MILNVDPKVDYAFKKLFGSRGREPLLIDVIHAVLGPRLTRPIESIEIANPFNEKDALNDKLSILDVKARDSANRWYNVEMQMVPDRYFRDRVLYYGSNLHSKQLREGEDYRLLQDTILISFVNGIIYRDVPDYRLLFELRNLERPELLFSRQLSIYLIELPKFQLAVENLNTPLERWCYLLRHAEGLDTSAVPERLKSPIIDQAVEVLSMLNQTPLEQERYESRLKAQRDYTSGLWGAHLDGLEEGEKKGEKKGILRGIQLGIQKSLRAKFGPSGSAFEESIQSVEDPKKLEQIFDSLLEVQSAEQFQQALTQLLEKPT